MSTHTSPVGLTVTNDADPGLTAHYRQVLGPDIEHDDGPILRLDAEGLALVEGGRVLLRLDPSQGPTGQRLRQAGIKREAIARACGLKHGYRPSVVDATAGLGRDGLVLAILGASVTLVERNTAIAALLEDGLRRAAATGWLAPCLSRVGLQRTDAHAYLGALAAHERPNVVYLDPMFEPKRRRGAVGGETARLATLAGAAGDSASLLAPARRAATNRVVVKRHRRAAPLADAAPSFHIDGRSTRFDVYLMPDN